MMEGWKECKLKEICEFKYGKNLPENKRIPGEYPVFGSSGVVAYHRDYLLKAPGIIVGRKGTVGKVQYSKEDYYPIDTTFYVDADTTKVDYNFLYYRLPLCGLESMNSDAAVPGLNRTAAINQKIYLPPLATQHRIATILSAYDDLIENNLKRIKLLEDMAQITYEEWFVRMKFPGHENAKFDKETGLPEGWKKVKLGEVCDFKYGKALKAENRRGGNYPVYGSAGIVGWHNDFICDGNGIIVGRKGTVGSVYWSEIPFFPIDTVYYIESKFPLYFVYYLLKEIPFINNDAAVPGLNRNAAYLMRVTLPLNYLLLRFSEIVKPIFKQIQVLKDQNQRLKEARDLLLPRLMSGKVDVDEINIERRRVLGLNK